MEKRKASNYVEKQLPKAMARTVIHTRDQLIHEGKTYFKLTQMGRPIEIITGLSKRKAQLWMCIDPEIGTMPQSPVVVPEYL